MSHAERPRPAPAPPAPTVELRPQTPGARADAGETVPTTTSLPALPAGPLGLPRAYWTLWLGMLLNRLGGSVFFLLGLYLTQERGLRPEVAGLVISLYAVGGLLGGPVGGALSDRIGRRPTLLTGTAVAGTLMLALGHARSTPAMAALAALLGFFTDVSRPPLHAAVADLVPSADRARAYGLLYWAMNLGFAGASVVGGALAVHHFELLFVIDALTTFGYGVIVLVGLSETRPPLAASAARSRTDRGLLAPLRDRPFMSFTLIQALLLVAFVQSFVTLPLDMRAHGLELRQIGPLLGLNGLFVVIAQPIALRYVRGVLHVHWLAAGALLTGLGLGATAFARAPFVYALTAVIWTLGEIGFSTASPTIVAELAPAAQRGAYQGIYQLSGGAAMIVAPALGSMVLAHLGSAALWGGCFAACLGAAALHLLITGPHVPSAH